MDGIELTCRLRARERKQKAKPVRIIACTGDTDRLIKERCLSAGVKTVLYKPLDLKKLALALEQGETGLETGTPASPYKIADQVAADMGHDPERIEEYLKLLWEDIHCELDCLDQAIETDDRRALKAATHTLKGLCGHLQDKGPELLALRLCEGALTSSRIEQRNAAALLRAICARLVAKD